MKNLIYVLLTVLCSAMTIVSCKNGGGDATGGVFNLPWSTIVSILYIVYELVVRIVPTNSNYSIIAKVIQFLISLVPNNKPDGTTHKF